DTNDVGIVSGESIQSIEWLNARGGLDGRISLREAMTAAHNTAGVDNIHFGLLTSDPGYNATTATWTIQTISVLPTILESVVINATTQTGFVSSPVVVIDGSSAGASVNGFTIHANSTVSGLSIRNFSGDGVSVLDGAATTVTRSTFVSNGGLAIDLGNDGVTANDSVDLDAGANNLQNVPVLTRAVSDGTSRTWASGNIHALANTSYRVELFSSMAADASGHGEGEQYLGTVSITTDSNGNATWDALVYTGATPGHVLTATATRIMNDGALAETSEFSLSHIIKSAPTAINLNAPARVLPDGISSVNLTDIIVSDADGDIVTAKLTLSTASGGTLSSNDGAIYDPTYGIWTITGTVAEVNLALAGVTFQTASYTYDVATSGVTILARISDSDGAFIEGSTVIRRNLMEPSGQAGNDQFGISVAVTNDWAIIGANADDTTAGSNAGSASIFRRNSDGTWEQFQQLLAPDALANDQFGVSVAIDGNRAVVGAHLANGIGNDSGKAYIYEFDGTSWNCVTTLVAHDQAASDYYGNSVAISGNTVAIGSYLDDDGASNTGSVYVYTGSGSTWTLQQKLTASDRASSDYFGQAIALDGNRLVVGAYLDNTLYNDSGSVYVFDRSGEIWSQTAKLIASDEAISDHFGISVDVSGDMIVVGSYLDDNALGVDAGSAYVYTWNGTTWSEAKLVSSQLIVGARMGGNVAVSGSTIAVGAYLQNTRLGGDTGQVFLYRWDGSAWAESTLVHVAPGGGDYFSRGLALEGSHLLAGAYLDDSPTG
ncbi:MAG: FG-GAP repeat protein, partial [Pirellula sp.]